MFVPAPGDRSLSGQPRPWPYPPDGARTSYQHVAIPEMERGEGWYWTLRLKTDPGQLIGSISLHKGEKTNRGFWLGLPWQNQGLMSEAADAVTNYWFETLKFSVLRVPKAIANEFSRRISQKKGMRVIAREERDFVSGRFPSKSWEITAKKWRARKFESM
jgi:[ribosomal protein S5]-alanine N-acetyltransferase